MAGISDILSKKWKGQGWTLRGDDYSTLTWEADNSLPKPSESEIRAFSVEVDAIILDERSRSYQQKVFQEYDGFLRCLEIFARVIDEIQAKIGEANLNPQNVEAIDKIRQKIVDIRKLSG